MLPPVLLPGLVPSGASPRALPMRTGTLCPDPGLISHLPGLFLHRVPGTGSSSLCSPNAFIPMAFWELKTLLSLPVLLPDVLLQWMLMEQPLCSRLHFSLASTIPSPFSLASCRRAGRGGRSLWASQRSPLPQARGAQAVLDEGRQVPGRCVHTAAPLLQAPRVRRLS